MNVIDSKSRGCLCQQAMKNQCCLVSYLYGCLPEGLQSLPAALLHVDHIPVVALQRPLQAVQRLEHQVLALIQLLLKNLQGVNLKVGEAGETPVRQPILTGVRGLNVVGFRFQKGLAEIHLQLPLVCNKKGNLKLLTVLI